jgi:hypothetical protein
MPMAQESIEKEIRKDKMLEFLRINNMEKKVALGKRNN